jgi:hypothetical protein
MNRKFTIRLVSIFAVSLGAIDPISLQAQVADPNRRQSPPFKPYVAEITGNDVYVRSGPSANFYPMTKLNAGDRVTVRGEVEGWAEIDPPSGVFSVIHEKFIDIEPEQNRGVINGDAVLVRAGSELSDHIYARQSKLNRGAEVTIVDRHNEDYLRVASPPDARVYVHAELLQRLPDARLTDARMHDDRMPNSHLAPAANPTTSSPSATSNHAALTGADDAISPDPNASDTTVSSPAEIRNTATADATTQEASEASQASPASPASPALRKLESDLAEELKKPLLTRDYTALLEGYKTLADRENDLYLSNVATARILQVEKLADAVDAVRKMRGLGEDLANQRKNALRNRTDIRPPMRAIGGGFDIVGELRPSLVFNQPNSPKRYRLVESGTVAPRTLAYIEITDAAELDLEPMIGREVGVRASQKRLQTGEVDPIVIYIASEVIPLDGDE